MRPRVLQVQRSGQEYLNKVARYFFIVLLTMSAFHQLNDISPQPICRNSAKRV